MAERLIKRPRNVILRLPKAQSQARPVPHTSKKPALVSTGVKIDRLCGICLGRLQPGVQFTFCGCGKFFHLACINEVKECPICHYNFAATGSQKGQSAAQDAAPPETDYGGELTEVMYQCPVCEAYVPENAVACRCGAVFDRQEGQMGVFICPGCGAEVGQNTKKCEYCGMDYGD